MTNNEQIKKLYEHLAKSSFSFVGGGEREIGEIYSAVKRRYPSLCSDRYLCSDNCIHGNRTEPEWKHRTRTALENLQKRGLLVKGQRRGAWILSEEASTKPEKVLTPSRAERLRALRTAEKAQSGGGFGTSEDNKRVEQAAMKVVTRNYESSGWRVDDVSAEKRGYDLVCQRGNVERHVEVKGVQGILQQFIITAREAKAWGSDKRYMVALVTKALSREPCLSQFDNASRRNEFDLRPITYLAARVSPVVVSPS